MGRTLLITCLALLASLGAAADPLPTVGITAIRDAIEGRRVQCLAIYAEATLTAGLSVTVAYGGSATNPADYTALTTIALPSGLATTRAIFIPITAVADADADGESITCTIQASATYQIAALGASATISVLGEFSDQEVAAVGEPNAISVEATTTWNYILHVRRPYQVPATTPEIPIQPFTAVIEAAPSASLPSFPITVTALAATDLDTVRFQISATPPTGGIQTRFRIRIKVDVDGDQEFIPSGSPTTSGQPSQDVFTVQDLVLAVRLLGAG